MPSTEFERFKKVLKASGNSVTKPRMRLFGLLQDSPALTMNQIIAELPAHDRVTAYRNVRLLEHLGILTSVRIGALTRVELSDRFQHHHHHMTCINCGKVLVLKDNIAIEKEIERISGGTGFIITDHALEIRGVCQGCHKAALRGSGG